MLTLPVKKKWFDMIVSGEKLEEYRDIKPYYNSRFKGFIEKDELMPIRLRNGYHRDAPLIECLVVLEVGFGKPEWGAEEGVVYHVLKIKEVKQLN